MNIVKAKTPVRYKGERYKIGETLEIDDTDMNKEIFELIEVVEEKHGAEDDPEGKNPGEGQSGDNQGDNPEGNQPDGGEHPENSKGEEQPNDNEVKKPLGEMTVAELKVVAKEKGIKGYSDMKKDELLTALAGE